MRGEQTMATSGIIYDNPWPNKKQPVRASTLRDNATRLLSLCDLDDPRSDVPSE